MPGQWKSVACIKKGKDIEWRPMSRLESDPTTLPIRDQMEGEGKKSAGRPDVRVNPLTRDDHGFSLLELLVVIIILAIVAAFAIPADLTSLRGYRRHSDAAAVASQMNVTRFRATSQYTPYRLTLDISNGTFAIERLNTSYSAPTVELGSVNLSRGNSFTTTNPGGSTYPGTITGGAAATSFYFNTRGMPVDNSGSPVSNGGALIYLTNNAGLTDAVVVSVGGRIGIYNWDGTAWKAR